MADDDTLRREFGDAMASPASAHVSEADWEALALHELPPHARDSILQHVITCAECSAVYRSLRALEDEARTFDPAVPAETPAASWQPRYVMYALAASLVLIVGGIAGYRALAPAQPRGESSPSSAPVAVVARFDIEAAEVRLSAARAMATRGAGDPKPFLDDFGRAIEPYRSGRYAEAARALEATASRFTDAYEPPFYQGVSLLLAGEPAASLVPLRRALDLAPESSRDEIRWYIAAALQRAGQVEESAGIFRGLCQGTSAWRARACAAVSPP